MQRVALSGSIDENSDVQGVLSHLTGDAVVSLREVERVNSIGVGRWIPAITKLSSQHRVGIEEIPYAWVQNANCLANLFGTAHVRSCMAPYYCSHCKDTSTVVVTAEDVTAAGDVPPPKSCARCGTVMEFDELEGYFAFFHARSRR
jgi:hypothetical protein